MNTFEKSLINLPKVHVGSVYEFHRRRDNGAEYTQRLKCVGVYEHYAIFEHERGYRECFINFDLKGVREK